MEDDKKTMTQGTAGAEEDLREIKKVYGPVEAELIKNFLESQGIHCLVRGLMAGFVYPFTVDGMAEFKVFVCPDDVLKARELLDGKFPEDPVEE